MVPVEGQQHQGTSGGLGFMLSRQRQVLIYFLLQRQNYSNSFPSSALMPPESPAEDARESSPPEGAKPSHLSMPHSH